MSEPPAESVVIVEPAQVPAARAVASAHGVDVQEVPRRGIEPVTTVTLLLVGTAAAVGTVLHTLEQRKGGQVIDLRPGAPKAFYRTPDLLYGMVVVIAVDGKVTIKVEEPDGRFGKVIAALPRLLPGSGDAAQVARAVSGEFGPDVAVETVPLPGAGGGE
jgi:hypothetical protein